MILRLFFLSILFSNSASFVPPPVGSRQRLHSARWLSANEKQGIEEMRRLLEASWNIETMGSVPTNAESAAEAAVTAINNALSKAGTTPLFFVDILLPQYDIRQGERLYDETLAVEFCIKMANQLKRKTEIIVKDDKTMQTVSRVLRARERMERDDVVSARPTFSKDVDQTKAAPPENTDFYDDFAELGTIGDSSINEQDPSGPDFRLNTLSTNDVDSFRQQLIADWSRDKSTTEEEVPPQFDEPRRSSTEKGYRLASMLGQASVISSGPDMAGDVTKAVVANALPMDDEEVIVILSASSKEEMIAVRSLVSKYEGKKTIILVNCSLEPSPRELIMAQTVYSVQPFIARPIVSENNIFGVSKDQAPSTTPPKIVVMRRYPRDWEVFVDAGDGFELAATIAASKVDKKGPSMQITAGIVKQHLTKRLG